MKKDKTKFNLIITWKSLKLLFRSSPMMSSTFFCIEIILSVIPIFSAKIVSDIVEMFTEKSVQNAGLGNVIFIMLLYIFMNVTVQIITPVRRFITEGLSEKIAKDSELLLNQKIISFYTLNCFENHDFYNEMKLARDGCGIRFISSLQMLSSLLRGIITIGLSAGYLMNINIVFGVLSLLSLVPNVFFDFWVSKNRVALYRSRTESARRLSYLSSVLNMPEYAKEVRLFDLGQYIIDRYKQLFDTEYKRITKVRKKHCAIGIVCGAIGAIVNGIALYSFVMMALNDSKKAGAIVLYISLLPQFINGLQMLINSLNQTRDNNFYIKHFFDFLARKEENGYGNKTLDSRRIRLQLKDVFFRYPNASDDALKGISLDIQGPALVAIVGENGSGKSTLIKLLMGLYQVTGGEILLNGNNMYTYDMKQLRNNMSGVFQNSARFSFTLRENLKLGNIHGIVSENVLRLACERAQLSTLITTLPKGVDTMLDKQFEDGIDLSGGQWQKVSLARSLCSDATVLFFDEASSELDPKAEQSFYKMIKENSINKLAFYITHRLSGVKDADVILVLKNGRLVEFGDHKTLMELGGEYTQLYHAQTEGYDLP